MSFDSSSLVGGNRVGVHRAAYSARRCKTTGDQEADVARSVRSPSVTATVGCLERHQELRGQNFSFNPN
jgi:hypothetical protein